MRADKASTKEIVFTILFFPVVILVLFVLLLITPFNYLKYTLTYYYKDTREKYQWFCTSYYNIQLYNGIKKLNLPIDYYRDNHVCIMGYGYFIHKDTLILGDHELFFDTEQNMWCVDTDDGHIGIKDYVVLNIENCNEFLKDNICKKAIILIDSDIYNEHPYIKDDLLEFVPVYNEKFSVALKNYIS